MVTVRRLSADEWQLWRDVRLAALADAPEAFTATLAEWSAADEERWRARFAGERYNAVAFDDRKPIGQVTGHASETPGEIKLISLWVAPQSRGTGTARALIDAVIAWSRTQGAEAVWLLAYPTNTAAIGLYERYGFSTASSERSDLVMYRYPLR